jgi:hypothetical protein
VLPLQAVNAAASVAQQRRVQKDFMWAW